MVRAATLIVGDKPIRFTLQCVTLILSERSVLYIGVVGEYLLIRWSIDGAAAYIEPFDQTFIRYQPCRGFDGITRGQYLVDSLKDRLCLSTMGRNISGAVLGFKPRLTIALSYSDLIEQIMQLQTGN